MSGLSKLFNRPRPRKSQSTPTKSFGCLPSKLSSSIPMNKRHTTPPTVPYQNQQQQPKYVMDDLDFVPHPLQDTGATVTATEPIKPLKKKKSYNAPLTVRNPTPDDYFYMPHSLADTPSREQVTRYTLVDNKSSAPMRKPTPFSRTNQSKLSTYVTANVEQAEDAMEEEVNESLGWSDYNRESKQQQQQQQPGKMFSTDLKSELEKMKQQLEDFQKERVEFKQQEKRHKRREKRMHQQILETREQLDSLLLSHSYEENNNSNNNNNNNDLNFRTTSREYNITSSSYTERPMLVKRSSVGSSSFLHKQHHQPSHYYQPYQPQYWYDEPSYHHHSYTSPSSSYFPPSLYQRYGSSLDSIYHADSHEHTPSHYSQFNWSQQRSSYQTPPSYFYDEPERLPNDEIRRKTSYSRRPPIPDWSY